MSKSRKSDYAAVAKVSSDEGYKVGPGRPPKEYQFRPGQSGNPKGAKRKSQSVALDLKAQLELALKKSITLKRADKEHIVTMAAAGMEQLVAQYVKGDHRARRDLFWLADKLGVSLIPNASDVDAPLPANCETILHTYVQRQYDKVCQPAPVLAPARLLDDDVES
jgi:hypothetical protein